MGKDLDFWKNRVEELEEECAEKQVEIDMLKSEIDEIHKQLKKIKTAFQSLNVS